MTHKFVNKLTFEKIQQIKWAERDKIQEEKKKTKNERKIERTSGKSDKQDKK